MRNRIIFIGIILILVLSTGISMSASYKEEEVESLIRQGDELILEKEYKKALDTYTKALDMNRNNALSHYKAGVAFFFLGDYEKSAESFKEAEKLDPSLLKATNNLALVYEKLGRKPEAISAYRKAISARPEYLKPRYNLAVLLTEMKRYDSAEEEALNILKINPKYARGYYILGLIEEHRKNYGASEDQYLKCLSISAKFSPAVAGLARVKKKISETSRFRENLDMAREMANFDIPKGYVFSGISETLLKTRMAILRNNNDQELILARFPMDDFSGETAPEVLLDGGNKDFIRYLDDMGISVPKPVEAGEFTIIRNGSGRNDGNTGYTKNNRFLKLTCLYRGIASEGIMILFKPEKNAPTLLFASLSPQSAKTPFSLEEALEFYQKLGLPLKKDKGVKNDEKEEGKSDTTPKPAE